MSRVKPCTSTAVWPWYRPRCPAETLAELAPRVKSCYVTRTFSAASGGDTVIRMAPRNSVPKRHSRNPARKRTNE